MSPDLWQRGCDQLATELSEQQFNTWIRALPPADITDDGQGGAVAQVRVPNRFKLDWIRSQYAHRIENILTELAGCPVRLELALAAREAPPARAVPANGPVRAAALLNGQAVAPSTSAGDAPSVSVGPSSRTVTTTTVSGPAPGSASSGGTRSGALSGSRCSVADAKQPAVPTNRARPSAAAASRAGTSFWSGRQCGRHSTRARAAASQTGRCGPGVSVTEVVDTQPANAASRLAPTTSRGITAACGRR